MNWETFYLICFVVGLAVSALSFLMGVFHLPHFPFHAHGGGLHHGGVLGHVHVPHGGAGSGHGAGTNEFQMSPLNLPTLTVFLAWFGAAGYLLTHYSRIWGVLGIVLSILVGVAGAAVVFWFMAKVLMRPDENLDAADYEMIGVLGRLTVGIREGGTGEIVYSQGGTRKTVAARSEDGRAVERGMEVVVTRYEKGVAYVRRWDELAGDATTPEDAPGGSQQAHGAQQH